MQINDMIHYNLFIRFLLQSALKFQIATATTIAVVVWTKTASIAQGIVAIIFLTMLTALPFIFGGVLWKNYENLNVLSVKQRIGSMYLGIRVVKLSIYALAYSLMFLIRRSFFVALTFGLKRFPGIQI